MVRIKTRAKKGVNIVIESSQSDSQTQSADVPITTPVEGEKSPDNVDEPSNIQKEEEQATEEVDMDDDEIKETDDPNRTIADVLKSLKEESASKTLGKRSKEGDQEDAGPSKKAKVASPDSTGTSKKKRKKKTAEKSKSQGKPSKLPKSWFAEKSTIPVWYEKFKDRTLANCSFVKEDLLEILNTQALINLKKSQFMELINKGSYVYPRLTKLFYFNLTTDVSKGKMVINSIVAGTSIEITQKLISKVLGIKTCEGDISNRRISVERAKNLFLLSEEEPGKQLTQAKLNCEGKLLFTILVRCIVPKASSRDIVTDKMLEFMYQIHEGQKLNAPSLIMEHMVNCSTKGRNTSLPYGNVLSLIFEHLGVPVEDEVKDFKSIETLDEQSLGKMGMCVTKNKEWKLFVDLSAEEKVEKKFTKPRTTTPYPTGNTDQIVERLNVLEVSVGELKTEVKGLGKSLGGVKDEMVTLGNLLKNLIQKMKVVETETTEESNEETAEDSDRDTKGKGKRKEEESTGQDEEEEQDDDAF